MNNLKHTTVMDLRMVQTQPVLGDTENNVERMLDFVDSKSDIVCFPELSMTGYSSEKSPEHSIYVHDKSIKKLTDAAFENNAILVFGFPELSDSGVYITQAIATPDGRLELYRKTHLGRFERRKFNPGNHFVCTKTENISIGLQLCWESHIPDISTTLRHMGAELILNPHASFKNPKNRVELWKRYLPARAYDNRVFFAACDIIGDKNGGGMIVIDSDGIVIKEHTSSDEYAIDCEIDTGFLKRSSPENMDTMTGTDFFLNRRPELYRL